MVALAKLTDIGGVTETALRGASVLVLEDELLLRKQVAAVLEQHEADVTAVGTVDEARRMIASLPFDFALLDVNLPDGLGTDLLSDGVFSPNTAVVVCTAEGGVEGAARSRLPRLACPHLRARQHEELPGVSVGLLMC